MDLRCPPARRCGLIGGFGCFGSAMRHLPPSEHPGCRRRPGPGPDFDERRFEERARSPKASMSAGHQRLAQHASFISGTHHKKNNKKEQSTQPETHCRPQAWRVNDSIQPPQGEERSSIQGRLPPIKSSRVRGRCVLLTS